MAPLTLRAGTTTTQNCSPDCKRSNGRDGAEQRRRALSYTCLRDTIKGSRTCAAESVSDVATVVFCGKQDGNTLAIVSKRFLSVDKHRPPAATRARAPPPVYNIQDAHASVKPPVCAFTLLRRKMARASFTLPVSSGLSRRSDSSRKRFAFSCLVSVCFSATAGSLDMAAVARGGGKGSIETSYPWLDTERHGPRPPLPSCV